MQWQKKRLRKDSFGQKKTEQFILTILLVGWKKLLIIYLRLLQGVPLPSFASELIPLEKAGFITLTPTHCRLTQKGILVYDSIAAELI